MLDSILNDLGSHSDTIVDHGYTGQIDQEHISDITGSILISLITKRQVYLKEFMKGLELYGLAEVKTESRVMQAPFCEGECPGC